MANPLLLRVAPELLARRRQAIESVEKLSTFKRLAAIVDEDLAALPGTLRQPDFGARPVTVSLEFGWADAQETLPRVTGRVTTTLPATCQRCLEPCEIELSADIDLLFVASGDAGSVDDALEVWELDEERVVPLEVAEEMLVMALPFAATHGDPQDCGLIAEPGGENAGDTVRPFADLKSKLEQSG